MTLIVLSLLVAIARFERALGQFWHDGRPGPETGKAIRSAALSAYLNLHAHCEGLLRRYLAETVLTPDAVEQAGYPELIRLAAGMGLVEDEAAWMRAGEDRAKAERELEGQGVVEDMLALWDFSDRARLLVGRVLDGDGVGAGRAAEVQSGL